MSSGYVPIQFFDEIARCASFARFLFGVGLLGFRVALEFILNGWCRVLNGRNGALVAAKGGVEGGYGG